MKQPVILLVDDYQMNIEMVMFLLHDAGFSTLEAGDAKTGIQIAKEKQPDLILMDMHMPDISGYEACELLKSDPHTTDIPIVAFTALAMEDELQKALDCGCIGIISKPFSVDSFTRQITHFLSIPGKPQNCTASL